ncbi:MAG: SWIM zinc finger family protein [Mobilibacterium timonense]|uniref:SWIM zinc finger family protein n=2 Tax=Mobilibacterium timonense TaxID=1871012 RepID=UPI0023531B0A|nr:SWIM zinc finger family protein [Mobilibacterium timonense]MBM6990730.1 SWIM zinc finger family protein [Mobilibacterium timonense]
MAYQCKDDWKELFAARILSRGYDYYLDGRVWNLQVSNVEVSATVDGTEEYCVTIKLADGRIEDMDCDCPYAADGNYCKHEAAVLYALAKESEDVEEGSCKGQDPDAGHPDCGDAQDDEKKKKPFGVSELEAEEEELRQCISRMSVDEMREMLFKLASDDESLRNRIAAMYSKTIDEKMILKMKNMVDEIVYEHSDQSGFIYWNHASDFVSDLIGFLHNDVSPLIDRGMLEEAFDLTCYVFITIGNAEVDDDGDIAYGADECCEFWGKIVSGASDLQQENMYNWFCRQIGSGSVHDYMEDYLDDFRMTGFYSKPILEGRLEELDGIICNEMEEYKKNKNIWKTQTLVRDLNNRIDTMIELEVPDDEVLSYTERYTFLPAILIRYAEAVYKTRDIDCAAGLLQKGKIRDAANSSAVSAYSRELIEFYAGQDMKKELLDELSYQVLNCYQENLRYIDRLRNIISDEEWTVMREEILGSESCRSVRFDLMHEEKLYDRLVKEILTTGSIDVLERYEKDLRPAYSHEIRDMYADHARNMIKNVSDRKQYRYVVAYLRKITRYDGGKALADSIAESWKQEYKRRPALIDEIRKAGF